MKRLLTILLLLPSVAAAQEFTYNPAGMLRPGSGTGRADAHDGRDVGHHSAAAG